MKGLIITLGIILAFIGAGIGGSAYIYIDLNNSIAAADSSGYEEGYTQGYFQGQKDGSETGYQEGTMVGYAEGGGESSGANITGAYFIYNPTYSEMLDILGQDEMNTAKEIHDYAVVNGVRVAYVRCPIAREAREGRVYLYQLVAFETVDRGLIIIEPKSHREVKVEVGKSYSELNDFPSPDYDDTVTKMTIVW
ncbi:hypothetical protein ACFLW0_02355 [Chloroflexota bacterium]